MHACHTAVMTKIIVIILFFVPFSFTECAKSFGDLRVRWTINENHVFELLEKSGGFGNFQKELKNEFKGVDFSTYGQISDNEAVKVRVALKRLIERFMTASESYVKKSLLRYNQLALRLIELKTKDDFWRDARELIGFQDGQDYCMLTALYDCGIDVHWLLETTLFFQTIVKDDDQRSIGRLEDYRHKSTEKFESIGFQQIKSKLNEIKQNVRDFSDLFCLRWTPFLNHRLVTKPAELDGGVESGNLFMQYVFTCERCVINFDQTESSKDQPNEITLWDCKRILESQEYRLDKYKEDVKGSHRMKQKFINMFKMCTRPPLVIDNPSEQQCTGLMYSLDQLKYEFQFNVHYLNVVKYDNVASHVMLMVSIKEGRKMFKGIKQVVTTCCRKQNKKELVQEICQPMSALAAFKATFDRLVSILLIKKRIYLANDPEKKIFEEQVNRLTTLLNVRDGRMAYEKQEICRTIPEELLAGKNYDAHLGQKPNKVKFEGYYFNEPLLNISQLYHFVANDF